MGATRRGVVPPLRSLKNLTIGLIWLVTRRVGQGGGQGGGDGGSREVGGEVERVTKCGGL